MGSPIDPALLPAAFEPTNPPNFKDKQLLSSIDDHVQALSNADFCRLQSALLSYKDCRLKKALLLFAQNAVFQNVHVKFCGQYTSSPGMNERIACGGCTAAERWQLAGQQAARYCEHALLTMDHTSELVLVKALLLLYAHDRVSTQEGSSVLVAGKMLENLLAIAAPSFRPPQQHPGAYNRFQPLSQGTAGTWYVGWTGLKLSKAMGLERDEMEMLFEHMMKDIRGSTMKEGKRVATAWSGVEEKAQSKDHGAMLKEALEAAKCMKELAALELLPDAPAAVQQSLEAVASVIQSWAAMPSSALPTFQAFLADCKEIRAQLGTDPAPEKLQKAISALAARLNQEQHPQLHQEDVKAR